jgi:hypothetical protein
MFTFSYQEKDKALNRLHIYSRRRQQNAKHSISNGNLNLFEEESIIAKLDDTLNNKDTSNILINDEQEEDNVKKGTENEVNLQDEVNSDNMDKHKEIKCDINFNERVMVPNSNNVKEKYDEVASALFESDESAEYTDPESADSSSTDESKESSVVPTDSPYTAKNEQEVEDSSFHSNR